MTEPLISNVSDPARWMAAGSRLHRRACLRMEPVAASRSSNATAGRWAPTGLLNQCDLMRCSTFLSRTALPATAAARLPQPQRD